LAQGECEAILLAEEEGAPLLVDERKARDAAVQRGIKVIGSPWVLKEAKQRGMILAVRPILEELLAIGYWLHPERVIHPFLQEMGEVPPIPELSQE
jgi:predicted nucleic acid-binding protein